MKPDPAPLIACRALAKRYNGATALTDFSLDVDRGTILGLLGPSGCGKTTALRVIAGFELLDGGRVEIGGRVVAGDGTWVPPEQRRVGMVFQDYALFPHLNIARNVGYGLPRDAERGARVEGILALVGLTGYGDRMPHELSGGEQQRVALARALAPRPEVILLDEPFSNLDAPQRDRMRKEVRAILVEARATAIFVTHDQEEALAISDVVAVMRAGTILQVGSPHEVYHRPAGPWLARFLGEGEFVPGTARGDVVETLLGTFPLASPMEGDVDVLIRPEAVGITADPGGVGKILDREFYGHDQLVTVGLPGGRRLRSRLGSLPTFSEGQRVTIAVDEVVAFPASGPS